MRILIVESDSYLSGSMRALIERWGHQAEECIEGKDALRAFISGPYDLVLMEVGLPDMKGQELIRRLKGIAPETRIVAMTDANSRELELQIREEGVLYYMVKPFETDSLRSLLEHLNKRAGSGKDRLHGMGYRRRSPNPAVKPEREGGGHDHVFE